MYKLFLLSVILTARLSSSCSTEKYNLGGKKEIKHKKDIYELQLNKEDPDVLKFVDDGWKKLVAEGKTGGTTNIGDFGVHCANVQVADTERRYIILVRYTFEDFTEHLLCVIFVMSTQAEPLSISCFKGYFTGHEDPAEREQRDMFFLFFRNNEFCLRK